MHIFTLALSAATLFPIPSLAFSDSIPFLAWSSNKFPALDQLSSRIPAVPSHVDIMNVLLSSTQDICKHENILVVEQPGLRISDLHDILSRSSQPLFSASSSKSHHPYVPVHSLLSLSDVIADLTAICGGDIVETIEGNIQGQKHGPKTTKTVSGLTLPELTTLGGSQTSRKASLHVNGDLLVSHLAARPSHLVLLWGTPSSTSQLNLKRQAPDSISVPFNNPFFSDSSNKETISNINQHSASNNTTYRGTGILAHYQLLTPGLLTALIITFGIFIPLLFFGISALASIRAPVWIDPGNKGVSTDKKN